MTTRVCVCCGNPLSPRTRSTRCHAHMARRRAQERGEAAPERLPEGAWSEHGQRVERALAEAERAADRAQLASLVAVERSAAA